MKGRFLTIRDEITNFTSCIFVGMNDDPDIGDKINIAMNYLRSIVFKIIEEEQKKSGVKMGNREEKFKININDIDLSLNYPIPISISMNSNVLTLDIINEYIEKWKKSIPSE